jgi:hypothetical protein
MNRFQITHVSKMIAENYFFEYHENRNNILCFTKINPITGFKEYYYIVENTCNVCNLPHFKRRGSPSLIHSKCKTNQYTKDKNV